MTRVYTEVDLTDIDRMLELVRQIYEKRRLNKDYQSELDQLIYGVTGKIV